MVVLGGGAVSDERGTGWASDGGLSFPRSLSPPPPHPRTQLHRAPYIRRAIRLNGFGKKIDARRVAGLLTALLLNLNLSGLGVLLYLLAGPST